ncbi:hypothetical protein [Streptomyces sp. or20]|uniref:hypothetical protein n=1 Tax=Streptomyces sp. or20 TaxID=1828016 RepID=UPI000BEF9D97|nr:hypothetical protein [Streptomyces sp. or20]
MDEPTSPTPADRPAKSRTTWPTAEPLQQAANLRRAAGDPLLADWLDATANALAWLAPYRDNEPGYGMWEAALAVARQLLGTTTACPECGTSGACNGGPCPLTPAAPPAPANRAAVLREVAEEFRATFGEVIVCGTDGDWVNVADWTATGARIPACGSFYPHHTDTRCVLHKGHRGSHRAPWGRRTMAWPYDRRETPPAAPAAPEEQGR